MSVAACLLLYSLAVAVAGPPLLRRLTGNGHVPRLGVVAWLTAIGSVLISWLAAAVWLAADVVSHWNHTGFLVASCLAWLGGVVTGDAGVTPQIMLLAERQSPVWLHRLRARG